MWSIVTPGRRTRRWRRGFFAALAGVGLTAFAVHAGSAQLERLVVRGVRFQGARGVDPDLLAMSIAPTQSGFLARAPLIRSLGLGEKRYFNQRDFQTDVFRVQVVMKRSGYSHAKLDTVVKRPKTAIDVTFKIDAGDPVILRSLIIDGLDSVEDAWRIRQDLPIAAGGVASDF